MTTAMALQRILPAVLAVLMFAALPARAGGAFLVEFEDLPLAPGLTEQPGGMLFDSPSGRIVDATAEGDLAAAEVRSFYAETLPQLGWEKVGDLTFRRDNELLRIDVHDGKRPLTVRFSVVPQ